MSDPKSVPHYSFSGSKGAYTVWQHRANGATSAVGTITRCVEIDYTRYGVPRTHRWKVVGRAQGITLAATDRTLTKAMAAWCRALRNRSEGNRP
jgi:hypothetical protein